MADYGDGNWYAATLGQFVSLLVDDGDTAVIFRQASVTPHSDDTISITFQVILVAEGHLAHNYLPRCKGIHKTLRALLDAGLTS